MVGLSDILETTAFERVATGFVFTEALWHPDGFFYFVDLRSSVRCSSPLLGSAFPGREFLRGKIRARQNDSGQRLRPIPHQIGAGTNSGKVLLPGQAASVLNCLPKLPDKLFRGG